MPIFSVVLAAEQPPHAPIICTNAISPSIFISQTSPPSAWMPGRIRSSAASTRDSRVGAVLLSIAFHHFVHPGRHRNRVVPFALPHVAPEDQADAARFHCDLRFV